MGQSFQISWVGLNVSLSFSREIIEMSEVEPFSGSDKKRNIRYLDIAFQSPHCRTPTQILKVPPTPPRDASVVNMGRITSDQRISDQSFTHEHGWPEHANQFHNIQMTMLSIYCIWAISPDTFFLAHGQIIEQRDKVSTTNR